MLGRGPRPVFFLSVLMGLASILYGPASPVSLVMVQGQTLDYGDALSKSILFFEGQRSGQLPPTQRVRWRNNSGLQDGVQQAGVPLVGGYYDAGDNVKFGFPLAHSMSVLAWAIGEYGAQLKLAGQLGYAEAALRWGTDFMLRCHSAPEIYWAQVGDGHSDHACWQRPEDMDTPRTGYAVTRNNPGTEVTAEAAAAMAAAAIVFRNSDPTYSATLLDHARQLFTFANNYRGSYSNAIPNVQSFYRSYNGYTDELMWAASWLYRATGEAAHLKYLIQNDGYLGGSTQSRGVFSWDDKRAGAHVLLAGVYMSGQYDKSIPGADNLLAGYKRQADAFACHNVPGSPTRGVRTTPQGLIQVNVVNSQYVISAAFLTSVYSDHLARAGQNLQCGAAAISPAAVFAFSKSQMDYLLGKNAAGYSYMVGFGARYPKNIHHRGASIVSINVNPAKVGCNQGYSDWYNRPDSVPNPNIHVGAIVGGPHQGSDSYTDSRGNHVQTEPTTYINPGAVGLLAKLYGLSRPPASPSPPPPVKRSPPPPPPASISQVTISQRVNRTWVSQQGISYTQYYVSILNKGPGNIKTLAVWSKTFRPKAKWNIYPLPAPNQYSFYQKSPNYLIGAGTAYTSFGYQQAGGAATFVVVHYTTDLGRTFSTLPPST